MLLNCDLIVAFWQLLITLHVLLRCKWVGLLNFVCAPTLPLQPWSLGVTFSCVQAEVILPHDAYSHIGFFAWFHIESMQACVACADMPTESSLHIFPQLLLLT